MSLLFLLGGSAAFDVVADVFVPAAGGREARIALLLQGGKTWKKYVSDYARPWEQQGASQYDIIVPDEGGILDIEKTSAILHEATGIFIGGGHTPTYHRLYATEPIRSIIRERYQAGVPVAGVSAGAMTDFGNRGYQKHYVSRITNHVLHRATDRQKGL
jgi:cyanophycinase